MESILQCEKKVAEQAGAVSMNCLRCGARRKEGVEWFDDNYCSGKCAREDVPPKDTCLCCGCVRKPNTQWYDENYCSGKCKKKDGGIIEVAAPQGDEALASTQKLKEIGELGNLLALKKIAVRELDAQLEELTDARGELLSKGLDTKKNRSEYEALDSERKAILADIELLETSTIPKKHQEVSALKRIETSEEKAEIMLEKDSIVEHLQNLFYEINNAVAGWENLIKETKVNLNPKEKDLFWDIIIFDSTRKQLGKRIAKRIAKKSVYPED